jgi:hypothetical protein
VFNFCVHIFSYFYGVLNPAKCCGEGLDKNLDVDLGKELPEEKVHICNKLS